MLGKTRDLARKITDSINVINMLRFARYGELDNANR